MIPRTKVNYRLSQLVRALFRSEQQTKYRDALTDELRDFGTFEHVLLTPSGRGALYHLLRALPQPRVIIPAYTCKAVVEAALLAGKQVEYADTAPNDFNMGPDTLRARLDASSIVIATHQFGIPCDIVAIRDLCAESSAFLIEDCAAALGTRIDGRLAGTFGDAAFFSFDSTKLVNVPLKAGFLAVRDAALFARVESLYRRHTRPMSWLRKLELLGLGAVQVLLENGALYRVFHTLMFDWRGRYTTDEPGLNLCLSAFHVERMAEWQAAIALEQVQQLELIIGRRRALYAELQDSLSGCSGFAMPPKDHNVEWACIRFPIRTRRDKIAFYREATKRGVDFAFSFTFIECPRDMHEAQRLARSVLDLPFYLKLTSAESQRLVCVLREIGA